MKTQQETVPEADIQSWLYAENIDAQVHLVGLIIYLKRTNEIVLPGLGSKQFAIVQGKIGAPYVH